MSTRTPFVGWAVGSAVALTLGACDLIDARETFEIPQDVERIVIHVDVGDLQLQRVADARVRVDRSVTGLSSGLELRSQVVDGVLHLDARCAAWVACSVDSAVFVPPGVEVSATVGEGRVQLFDLDGVVDVSVSDGVILGEGLGGREVALATGSGDVDLALEEAPAILSVAAGVGDVRLELPAGQYETALESARGGVTLDGIEDGVGPRIAVRLGEGELVIIGAPEDEV